MQYFTITVANNTLSNQHISFFQAPSIYTLQPSKDPLPAYTNCLYSDVLAPATKGSSLTFASDLRYYAHAHEGFQKKPVEGQISIFEKTTQLIGLNGAIDSDGKPMPNATTLSLSPFALSTPVVNPTVTSGAFRITTQDDQIFYNVGLALFVNGVEIMSNYVRVNARLDIDCAPALKFYVVTGPYIQGAPIDLGKLPDTYALCDFSRGYSRAMASLDPVSWGSADSKWTVRMLA